MNLYHCALTIIACASAAAAQSPTFQCDPPQLVTMIDGPRSPEVSVLVDDYAYIIDDDDGLVIVDLTDPTNPVILSQTDMTGIYGCYGISVNGPALYLNCDQQIAVINIEDPTAPWFRRFMPIGDFTFGPVAHSDTHIYRESYALNITRPLAPAPDPYANASPLDSDPIAVIEGELIT